MLIVLLLRNFRKDTKSSDSPNLLLLNILCNHQVFILRVLLKKNCKLKFSLYIFAIILLTGSIAKAQGPKEAGYLRFPTVPPFTVVTTDSTNFTKEELRRNTPTLIMYFNPGCDHCKHQTDSIIANMDQFKKMQIVMASYAQPEEISTFYTEHNLESYANIHVGRDTKYFFQPFYKIMNLPFLALYDKKGKLLTTFEGTTPIAKLLEAFDKN